MTTEIIVGLFCIIGLYIFFIIAVESKDGIESKCAFYIFFSALMILYTLSIIDASTKHRLVQYLNDEIVIDTLTMTTDEHIVSVAYHEVDNSSSDTTKVIELKPDTIILEQDSASDINNRNREYYDQIINSLKLEIDSLICVKRAEIDKWK